MSGLLANLVGAATAALNLRASEPGGRGPSEAPREGGFAAVLSAALSPRQRLAGGAEEAATSVPHAEAGTRAPDEAAAAAAPDGVPAAARPGEAAGPSREDGSEEPLSLAAPVAPAIPRHAGEADPVASAPSHGVSPSAALGQGQRSADASPVQENAIAAARAPEEPETVAASPVRPGPVPRSPTSVRRSVEALNPEFRARLGRVIERMETEHGHHVEIVETVRDQARQNYLYAQGRTRPGPVVTWTRSSNHTEGRAADLIVDGTYDNPLAMVRLARIAREEGLRTLGARDPGHVELPDGVRVERLAVGADATASLLTDARDRGADAARTAVGAGAARANAADGMAVASRSGRVAMPSAPAPLTRPAAVARVAPVARPADVAQVAAIARVATPGSAAPAPAPGRGVPVNAPEPTMVAIAAQPARSGAELSGESGRRDGGSSSPEPTVEPAAEPLPRAAAGTPFGGEARTAAATAAEVRGAPASFGAEAAERIARVLQLQDTAPARPLSQMVLRLDNAVGGEDRIRVDLRGSSVGADLNVGDPVTAARLQSDLAQLQKALEGRGLQAEHLSVTSALAGRELTEALRSGLPSEAGQRSGQDPSSQRDGWNGRPGGRSGDADPEHPRQRSRRDSQQERNT